MGNIESGSAAITRRRFVMSGGMLVAATALPRVARAAETIVAAQPGGPYEAAWTAAFAKPFEAKTGVKVEMVGRPYFPAGQIESQVKSKAYSWHVVSLSNFDMALLGQRGMLERLDLTGPDYAGLPASAKLEFGMGVDMYATVFGYRTDTVNPGPATLADFWNTKDFPGRRSLAKFAIGTLEQALLADGVPANALYPLDVERAFASLGKIRKSVDVWWNNGAQSSQMFRNGEIDMASAYNGRIQAAIDDGAPCRIVWNQGMYTVHGWSIPKGAPKADIAREFIRFCASPERQAAFTETLTTGPTNLEAFKFIPADRAKKLPTHPETFKQLFLQDPDYWNTNKTKLSERFDEWLLAGR